MTSSQCMLRQRTRSRRRGKEEPIARLRSYLVGPKAWGKSDEEQLVAECHQRVEAAVERYLATPPRPSETMFDHLYAELPAVYASQREELERTSRGAKRG